MRALAAAAAVAALAGCGAPTPPPFHGADLRIIQPDARECTATTPADDDACLFDFGAVTGADPVVHVFDVVNVGDVDGTVVNIELLGDPSFRVEQPVPQEVPAGEVAHLTLSTHPLLPTVISATAALTYRSRANEANIALQVTASHVPGAAPRLEGHCGFGDVAVGVTSEPCVLTIVNDGGDEAQLDSITGVDDVFGLDAAVFIVPTFIAPGTSFNIAFTATPSAAGARSGSVGFAFNDGEVIETALDVNGI